MTDVEHLVDWLDVPHYEWSDRKAVGRANVLGAFEAVIDFDTGFVTRVALRRRGLIGEVHDWCVTPRISELMASQDLGQRELGALLRTAGLESTTPVT